MYIICLNSFNFLSNTIMYEWLVLAKQLRFVLIEKEPKNYWKDLREKMREIIGLVFLPKGA